jgi:hypothetical protein
LGSALRVSIPFGREQDAYGGVLGEVKALLTEVRDELRSKSRVA